MTIPIINGEFEQQLKKLGEEGDEIQKEELSLRQKQGLFMDKLHGFLKEQGLPENFTLPQLALFAIRKSRAA